MKPLISELREATELSDLGRASVQIVHDLKNQLNGLKLYATFLRKRMEKAPRPADELETINKLIAGLERAATDMTVMVRYGRAIELRRSPGADLAGILHRSIENGATIQTEDAIYAGAFDAIALTEALQNITSGVYAGKEQATGNGGDSVIHLRRDDSAGEPVAVIEWREVKNGASEDLFQSFAGSNGLRMALAAKVIKAHGGDVTGEAHIIRVRLPLEKAEIEGE